MRFVPCQYLDVLSDSLLQRTFDIKLGLTKSERLQMKESAMTHAMVISAVHLDGKEFQNSSHIRTLTASIYLFIATGQPTRYKVENSWGDTAGKDGYFVMTDKWFDQ